MTIGEYIKNYCKSTGTTNKHFAEKCGVTKGYISQLINGRNPKTGKPITPTIETYIRIAEATNITIDELFDIIDDVPVALKEHSKRTLKSIGNYLTSLSRTDAYKSFKTELSSVKFAFLGEVQDMTDEEIQDMWDYHRFKRAQKAKQEEKP